MLKKLAVGVLVVLLGAVLAMGAINRTNARTTTETGQGNGRSALVQGQGQGGGRRSSGESAPAAPGRGARNQTPPGATVPGTGQAEVDEWVTLSGVVNSASGDDLVVALGSGGTLELANRIWTFALDSGFIVSPGDKVTMVGFYEDGDFEVAQIKNETTGKSVAVRDDSGRPLWAGRGRGRS